jgi:CBS domain-containing protein
MKIQEIMTRDVKIVTPDTPLATAARLMRDIDTGFLPIGENDRLVGTITDRDIAVRAVAEGKDPNTAHVREAMSNELTYVFEDQDVSDAARIMGDRQIRRLPVLNRDKRLVGIVALADIAVKGGVQYAGQPVRDVSQPPKAGI